MKTTTYVFALALSPMIAACSDSSQQQKSNTQCSFYDSQCGISQVPGLYNSPGDHGPNPMPTGR
jgi:hypothetical protein